MKKISWIVLSLLGLIFLVACQEAKTETDQTVSSSSVASNLIKTQVFELELANGQKQVQTVIYKGEEIQKLILKNGIEPTESISQSIAEVGLEETKQRIETSMSEDEVYRQLDNISGLQHEIQLESDGGMFLLFTLDVPNLDTLALAQNEMFVGSELDDVKTLKAEEYITRLKNYGAVALPPQ